MTRLKFLLFALLIFAGCKIGIESPYQDADGIYLEFSKTYSIEGKKFTFLGDTVISIYESWSQDIVRFHDIELGETQLKSYFANDIINDFILYNNYLVIVLKNFGIKVLDISRLENIYVHDSLEFEDENKSIIMQGNTTFLLTSHKIYLIDCTDINNLTIIKTLQFDSELIDFAYYSEKLYVNAGEKCIIVDIKDLTDCYPVDSFFLVYHSNIPSNAIAVNKNFLYSARYELDVYNLTNKQREWTLRFPNEPVNIYVFDRYGIIIYYRGSASLLNLEYPSKPAILGQIESHGSYRYGIIRDNKIYLISDIGLSIFLIKETKE
jgi:hypothetical protein